RRPDRRRPLRTCLVRLLHRGVGLRVQQPDFARPAGERARLPPPRPAPAHPRRPPPAPPLAHHHHRPHHRGGGGVGGRATRHLYLPPPHTVLKVDRSRLLTAELSPTIIVIQSQKRGA